MSQVQVHGTQTLPRRGFLDRVPRFRRAHCRAPRPCTPATASTPRPVGGIFVKADTCVNIRSSSSASRPAEQRTDPGHHRCRRRSPPPPSQQPGDCRGAVVFRLHSCSSSSTASFNSLGARRPRHQSYTCAETHRGCWWKGCTLRRHSPREQAPSHHPAGRSQAHSRLPAALRTRPFP